jgi:hypothetical protein
MIQKSIKKSESPSRAAAHPLLIMIQKPKYSVYSYHHAINAIIIKATIEIIVRIKNIL